MNIEIANVYGIIQRGQRVVAHALTSDHTSIAGGDRSMAAISLIGQRFGRLTVEAFAGRRFNGTWSLTWRCRCDCGNVSVVRTASLRAGVTRSCGCVSKAAFRVQGEKNVTHGEARRTSRSPEYNAWIAMHRRCRDPRRSSYKLYGGRGITVCERWQRFSAFLVDMGRRPSPAHSVDRIDPNGNYEPANCRWATTSDQQINRRDRPKYEFQGERLTLVQWSRKTGIKAATLYKRITSNWDLSLALSTPPGKSRRTP